MSETHLKVLQMIQDGVISAEEGEALLDALGGGHQPDDRPEMALSTQVVDRIDAEVLEDDVPVEESVADQTSASPPAWARWVWVYVLAAGVLLLALAGITTALLVQGGSRLGWLACTLPLMGFGALVVALAWWSRTARWLHVRIRDAETRINFSLPLPLRPAAWLARLARPWVPQLRDTALDELILSLAEMDDGDGVLAVEVNEGEGEEVRIYFG